MWNDRTNISTILKSKYSVRSQNLSTVSYIGAKISLNCNSVTVELPIWYPFDLFHFFSKKEQLVVFLEYLFTFLHILIWKPISLPAKLLNGIKLRFVRTRREKVGLIEILRVRAVFHKTVRVCHVYCNFKIGFTCRITVIFRTLKDVSLLITTLASNLCYICFSYRNIFQNGVDALSKIVDAFLCKSLKSYLVRIIR